MADQSPHDIFISHSSKDSPLALAIRDFLKGEGYSPWMAPQDIPPGTSYPRAIVSGIKECTLMLVVITPHANESENVLNEVEVAHRNRKTLIPLIIGHSPMGNELGLYLNRKQWIDITAVDTKLALQPLLAGVKQYIIPAKPAILRPQAVDLGLSVKWATFNLGAATPLEPGDYFAWGEIAPKTDFSSGNAAALGKPLGDIAGNPSHDAARALWGAPWRLPTMAEAQELVDKCRWEWNAQEAGYKVTSQTNGKAIFLPAAGKRDEKKLSLAARCGGYWTSTPPQARQLLAYDLIFGKRFHQLDWNHRHIGFSIRPVRG